MLYHAREVRMYRICLFILLIFCTQVQAAPKSEFLNSVYKLPVSIYDVKGVGSWRKGEQAGQIRLVITRSSKRDRVFLQWVAWDKKGPARVKSTVQVMEIEQDAKYKITFIRRESAAGNRQVVLGLQNLYDKSAAKAIIKIQDIGSYSCIIQ